MLQLSRARKDRGRTRKGSVVRRARARLCYRERGPERKLDTGAWCKAYFQKAHVIKGKWFYVLRNSEESLTAIRINLEEQFWV